MHPVELQCTALPNAWKIFGVNGAVVGAGGGEALRWENEVMTGLGHLPGVGTNLADAKPPALNTRPTLSFHPLAVLGRISGPG